MRCYPGAPKAEGYGDPILLLLAASGSLAEATAAWMSTVERATVTSSNHTRDR